MLGTEDIFLVSRIIETDVSNYYHSSRVQITELSRELRKLIEHATATAGNNALRFDAIYMQLQAAKQAGNFAFVSLTSMRYDM